MRLCEHAARTDPKLSRLGDRITPTVRFGRYELLRRLGRGGMAEVFLARYRGPESFEKRLVIKRVLPERSRDRAFLTLFFEEARLHSSLSHGNLVPVFDFGRVGNLYFIAMEYVPGTDLGAILGRGALSPTEVAYVGIELCRGLGYVHRRGLVHRDVTPRNVLVSTEGEVKLSDFGVALSSQAALRTGLRGTPAYMAPEQARGEALDGRADLYALGLVLIEALTGKRVRGAREGENAAALATTTLPLLPEGALSEVLLRAAAPAAADRFADADAMLAALEAALKSLPSVSTGPARALGARGAELANGAREEPVEAEASVGPATYFRDAATVAEGMEQLHATLVVLDGQRRRGMIMTLIVAILIGAGIAVAGARWLRPLAAPPATTLNLVREPRADLTAAPNDLATMPSPPALPLPDETMRKRVTPARVETGRIRVQCTPWCVPLVDGTRRGDGARVHVFSLTAGKHRLGAQRLDDRQEREIDIQPRRELSIDFTFQ
jgi:tRNA A-37 threonylcarbamoyl transferase component Bud32